MFRRFASLLPLSLLLACASATPPSAPSSLPDYARPRAQTMRRDDYAATDVTRYRQLTREDFRATRPPAAIAGNEKHMGAYTCATIVPQGDSRVVVASRPDGTRVARLDDTRFHAEMDRGCSWWNRETRLDPAYILEHEQIHFAMTEVQARRLTAQVRGLEAIARDPQRTTEELQRGYQRMAEEATQALVRDSTRFDEDTSFNFSPEVQRRWRRTVEQQLAELEQQLAELDR